MKKALSRLPIPGRKTSAAARLKSNNNWQNAPDFNTTLSESEDDDGRGANPLTSANLRAHKGRPVTNEGQRLKRGMENAQDWVSTSPAGANKGGETFEDDYSDDSTAFDRSSRLDLASSKLGDHHSNPSAIQPFRGREKQQYESSSGGEDKPLGQKMFNKLTRQRSAELSTTEGKRKQSAKKRGESAGRKVTYNLTEDSESMDELELTHQRSGLMYGIHRGPSYHDPFEREISGTLDVYNSRRITKSRSSSRGGQGVGGLDSERSMLSTMDSPQARARALAEADNLMDMYAQPKGTIGREAADSHRSPESSMHLPASSRGITRPKSVLRSSAPQDPIKLQYADGLGGTGTTGGQRANTSGVQLNISDSSESEGDNSYSNGVGQYGRRVRSRNGYEDSDAGFGSQARIHSESNARVSTAHSMTQSHVSHRSRGPPNYAGEGGATATLARTLNTINRHAHTGNSEYMPDLDDSDSDVLNRTDSDADGSEQPDTMRRLELVHAKTAPFTLGGTNDFDSFMKAVDKSVNKAVKLERRSQKSRSGSRPASRALSRGESRSEGQGGREKLASRSGSRAEMRRQQQAGSNIISTTSTSDRPVHPLPDVPASAGAQGKYVPPQRPHSQKEARAPTVVKELGASVGLRRQHLANIENGRVIPHSPQAATRGGTAMSQPFSPGNTFSPNTPMRRPVTTHEDIVLAEQQEEMEILRQQQQDAMKQEREQQEILNRLKRDKSRREVKHKDQQHQLENLWEEQMTKDDMQYQQQKEIERLRHTIEMRDQRDRVQQDELERLRRDVSERARADAEGAMAFDKLLVEKHKKLLYTPAEIRQQVDEQLQREQIQREHEAELRKVHADEMQANLLKARQEQIERDGSKHASSGISKADMMRHRSPAYDEDGKDMPWKHMPSSRPATQLSMQQDASRPGTGGTSFTVDSTSTSIREVKEASEAAAQMRQEIKQAAAHSKFKAQQIPGHTTSGGSRGDAHRAGAHGTGAAPSHKITASASKETPDIAKERHTIVKKLNLDQIKSRHEKAPALKQYEREQQVRNHTTELQRANDDARHQAEFAEAQRVLEGPQSRERAKRAPSSAHNIARAESGILRVTSCDTPLQQELQRLEEEKAEFERREMLHEEYIEQLKFEQEEKLEREAAKRKALQNLRGENNLIDRMLRETDQIEGGLIKEVGTLEALKEQFKRKQQLAEILKEQQRQLAEKQKEREAQLKSLKSEVSKASDAAGIQMMQMNRLRTIQEEALYMQEQQHKELEHLKAELKRKADITGEAQEIARLREEAKTLEAEQFEQRAKLGKEKAELEMAMQSQLAAEQEMQALQKEKQKRGETERYLRQTLASEEREMAKLSTQAAQRRSEIEALQAERDSAQREIEGTEKEVLQQELEELRKRKVELAENEAKIAREKHELKELNRLREEELRELEALRKRSEEIERAQAKAKREEEEALRIKENKERARLRAEEDRIRAALEFEAKKAQQEMEKERKRRQNEIDRLKKEIEQKNKEAPLLEEEEEEEEDEEKSPQRKVSDWLQSNNPDDVDDDKARAKADKKKRKKSAVGDITARSMNDNDDEGGGDMTDRSDSSTKGPPTQWRLARHGKIKELEAILTALNVDDRDPKGNTCLHHACMQGKKRVAKSVLRLGADINAQNNRGHTCLHYCFAYSYEELGEYLISKGGDETILNELGATCREVESGSMTNRSDK